MVEKDNSHIILTWSLTRNIKFSAIRIESQVLKLNGRATKKLIKAQKSQSPLKRAQKTRLEPIRACGHHANRAKKRAARKLLGAPFLQRVVPMH